MIHDKYLYDRHANAFTVDKFLHDVDSRYNGIDSVLLWQAYPNIGLDPRNQFELLDDLPAGGLAELVTDFHAHGVKVFIPYNPWDTGTHESADSDVSLLSRYVQQYGVDGFNGDTMYGVSSTFIEPSLRDPQARIVVAQPEEGLPDESVAWNKQSWAYLVYPDGSYYSFVPMVSRPKWLESRHMVQVANRFCSNHTADLQIAFFNGIGFETWENVWGIWNGLSDRDAESTKRISKTYRFFSERGNYYASADWIPFVPITQTYGIFASMFPASADSTAAAGKESFSAVWNIVNRLPTAQPTTPITLPCDEDTLLFDILRGQLIPRASIQHGVNFFADIGAHAPASVPGAQGSSMCSYDLPSAPGDASNALMFASLLSIREQDADEVLHAFLRDMHAESTTPLDQFSAVPRTLLQTMDDYGTTAPSMSAAAAAAREGMQLLPAAAAYEFVVQGLEIESGLNNGIGCDCQFPWERQPTKYHNSTLAVPSLYMDVTPVTNYAYKLYLDKSQYSPAAGYEKNFLKDWSRVANSSTGATEYMYPEGWSKKPVNWVTVDEARQFCSFLGKRLPNDWEWQYAAQGGVSTRQYPWGNVFDYAAVPQFSASRDARPLDDVDAHIPEGLSAYGIADMYGNAWELTNTFNDDRTRSVLLRGGSLYFPQGSDWYLRQSTSLLVHNRQLLMAPGLDRSSMVAFRCVMDA